MKKLTAEPEGYTLTELLVVMTLTAILSLGGVHGWQRQQHAMQLANSARGLAGFILRQQLHAVWGNRHCRIEVTIGERWQLRGDPRCGAAGPSARTAFDAPFPGVQLSLSAPGFLGLVGLRNTATPAHLILTNPAGRIRIILSGRGRLRLCSERGRWTGIAPC